MKRKVRITKGPSMPQAKNGVSVGLDNYFQSKQKSDRDLNPFGEKDFKLRTTMEETDGVPNIEAEKGEVIMSPGEGGIPDVQMIGGKPHSKGGTKITASEGSVIFSNTPGMRITDPEALEYFGMSASKKGYTPAEIAKKFITTKDKEALLDPNGVDSISERGLKRSIKEKHKKLLDLAIYQESMKNNPIPDIAMSRAQELGINPEQSMPAVGPGAAPAMAQYGTGVIGDASQYSYKSGGMYKAQEGFGGREYKWTINGTLPDGSPRWVKVYVDQPATPPARPTDQKIMRDPNFITPDGTDPFADPAIRERMLNPDFDYSILTMNELPKAQQGLGRFIPTTTDFANETYVPKFSQPQTMFTRSGSYTDQPEAKISTRTTKKQNVPKDRIKKEGEPLEVGDYILRDGKYYKVTRPGVKIPEYKGTDRDKVFGTTDFGKQLANKYQFLEDSLKDEDVKKALAERTRAALKNEAYYARKNNAQSRMGFMTDAEIDALTDDQILNQHLEMQKRNYAVAANALDPKDFDDATGKLKDSAKDKYKSLGITSLDDFFEKIGMPAGQGGKDKDIGLQQATYFGYRDLLGDENVDPALKDKLQYFAVPQWGEEDESQTGDTNISPIDLWYTNTTAGQLDQLTNLGEGLEEAPWTEETETTAIEQRKKLPAQPPTPKPAYWWAEDIGNVANLFGQRTGIKKYLPGLETVDLQTPDVLYYDPNQELFANQAATKAAYDFMAGTSPSGPISTSRASGLAGDEMERAAQTIGRYYNMNVPIGNQYFQNVAQTKNQEALTNAQSRKRFFDETVTANQQYDNAIRQANRNLFEGWRQGVHNMRRAQAINTMYPNFYLNPAMPKQTISFWEGRPLEDTGSTGGGTSAYMDRLNQLKSQYGDQFTDEDYRAAVRTEMGGSGRMSPEELQRQQLMQMYSGIVGPNGYTG